MNYFMVRDRKFSEKENALHQLLYISDYNLQNPAINNQDFIRQVGAKILKECSL